MLYAFTTEPREKGSLATIDVAHVIKWQSPGEFKGHTLVYTRVNIRKVNKRGIASV